MSAPANTPAPHAGRQFPTTTWPVGAALQPGSPEHRLLVESLSRRYWTPICAVIRGSWARSDDEAADLAQAFFAEVVLASNVLQSFDPARGRFRSFLRGALTNFLRTRARDAGRLKRGGGQAPLPLDGDRAPVADGPVDDLGARFDEAWRQDVLGRALERLAGTLRARGAERDLEVLRMHDLGEGPPPSYAQVAQALGLTERQVKRRLASVRDDLRQAIIEELSGAVTGPAELADELRELLSF